MAGYSGTHLSKKLGLKPGMKLYVHGVPEDYFDWIAPLPDNLQVVKRLTKETEFVHLFVVWQKDFMTQFNKAQKHLKKDGMIWVSWPKKAARQPTDLDENIIRAFGLRSGMVDVKVCAVSEIWSGLKFVFRLKDR